MCRDETLYGRTLVYKRTHSGDPDPAGRFGIHDCDHFHEHC